MSPAQRRPILRLALQVAAGLLLLAAALVAWAFIEPRLLLVSRSTVYSPDLPDEYEGAQIAFVSDIHAGTLLGEGRVARVLDRVTTLGADHIVLGGDYIGGGDGGTEMFLRQAPRIRAKHGAVAVLGNHEAAWESEWARQQLGQANVVLLENENARLRRNAGIIRIAGVEDLITGDPSVAEASRGIRREDFAILVSHNPDLLPEQLKDARGVFDLVLTGHTHGGQISLFGLYAPYLPSGNGQRFNGGWTEVDGVPVLVSRGAGVFIAPVRFFAPPEVHLIELRQSDRKTQS